MMECSTFVLSLSSACSRRRRASSSSASPREREPRCGLVVGGGTLFDLPSELVTQVDGTVSGCLADANDRCNVFPGELGVSWLDGPCLPRLP
jgi:hypothetical protein